VTYCEDLAPYTYLPETVPAGVTIRCVGWLDAEHPFATGEAPGGFPERLGALCAEHTAARTRGFHWCELCPADEADYPVVEKADGQDLSLGSAEVRVVAASGDWLAAPDLVYHYVRAHRYLPPQEFIDAVLAGRVAPDIDPGEG
jgi:hypothetical protein